MRTNKQKIFYSILFALLTLAWLFSITEIILIVACHDFCTAGELFAFLIPNKYEANDITMYILRFEMPYVVGFTIAYILIAMVLWKILKVFTKRRIIISASIVLLVLLPFVIPGQPCCISREIMAVVYQILQIKKHHADSNTFEYHACKLDTISTNEVYVFSVGESMRYKNLSLNGTYSRVTTPSLQNIHELYLYSNYYAGATLTQYALPLLLTGMDKDNYNKHFRRKTLTSAFAEAGFYTALISNRAQIMNNGLHDYLAHNFDTIIFVKHDSLIAPIIQELTAQKRRMFVITHYLGNHFLYRNCPDNYRKWLPDYNVTPRQASDSLYINAYDNSILYQDKLLSESIDALSSSEMVSAWLYVSDHGERIMPQFGVHGHTYHPTKDEYHVPLMVWYSDEYAAAYPDKVANMKKHKDEPVCADHVFWSVLDMAGIRIDSTLQQDGMSIFGDTLLPHKRTLLLPDGKSVMEFN